MVALVKCKPCREGRHEDCERGASAPPGMIGGGWICDCGCRGASLDGTFQEKMKGITMTPKPKAEETLKACGHCNGKAKIYCQNKMYRIVCQSCGLRTAWYLQALYAIEAWHERTPAKDEGEDTWLMFCDGCDMYDTCRIRTTPRMDDTTKYPCPFKIPDLKPTAPPDDTVQVIGQANMQADEGEEKYCGTCRFEKLSSSDLPCRGCRKKNHWRAKPTALENDGERYPIGEGESHNCTCDITGICDWCFITKENADLKAELTDNENMIADLAGQSKADEAALSAHDNQQKQEPKERVENLEAMLVAAREYETIAECRGGKIDRLKAKLKLAEAVVEELRKLFDMHTYIVGAEKTRAALSAHDKEKP